MKRWAIMTGGLLIWATHFIGVYLIASTADVVATAEDARWKMGAIVFSLACLGAVLGLAWPVLKGRRAAAGQERFETDLALGACLIGGVGITFQTLPLLLPA